MTQFDEFILQMGGSTTNQTSIGNSWNLMFFFEFRWASMHRTTYPISRREMLTWRCKMPTKNRCLGMFSHHNQFWIHPFFGQNKGGLYGHIGPMGEVWKYTNRLEKIWKKNWLGLGGFPCSDPCFFQIEKKRWKKSYVPNEKNILHRKLAMNCSRLR